MREQETQVYFNHMWNKRTDSLVTLITPVYNRRGVLPRALSSVNKQTYDNFEYIIVNDGSIQNLDDIVFEFMNNARFPVLYIKKENGGVHTARNIATKHARGYYWVNLDSDDELIPQAIEVLVNKWDAIPLEEKEKCFEVRACCMNQNGERVGDLFPSKGKMSIEEWNKQCRKMSFENIAMRITQIMKDNLFPEPEGVKFVPEFLLWKKLEKSYLSYYVNDIVRVYHLEPNDGIDDHLARNRNLSIRDVESVCWKSSYIINNWSVYNYHFGIKGYFDTILRFCMYAHVLKKNGVDWKKYNFNKSFPKVLRVMLWWPTLPLQYVYIKRRMSV